MRAQHLTPLHVTTIPMQHLQPGQQQGANSPFSFNSVSLFHSSHSDKQTPLTHTTHTHTENSHTESLLTPKNSHSARHTHKAFLRHSKSATHTSRRRAGPDSACQTLTPVVFTATSNRNDCWGCFVVACSQPTDERKGGSERAHIFFLFVEKYFGLIPSLGTFRCVYVRLLVVFACVFLCGGVGSLKRPCLRQYLGLCVLVAGRLTL
jgi:hypothetical protein